MRGQLRYWQHILNPGGVGLGIFTDRDEQSIFGCFEFRKSVFFVLLLTVAVFCFWVVR